MAAQQRWQKSHHPGAVSFLPLKTCSNFVIYDIVEMSHTSWHSPLGHLLPWHCAGAKFEKKWKIVEGYVLFYVQSLSIPDLCFFSSRQEFRKSHIDFVSQSQFQCPEFHLGFQTILPSRALSTEAFSLSVRIADDVGMRLGSSKGF